MDFLESYHILGLFIGLCTFLIIGLFHPLVVKGEYYFSVKIWWAFLAVGIGTLVASLLVDGIILPSLLGVTSFSSFWGILEVFQQQERVHKGWFPRNPKRRYYWDKETK